MDQPNLTEEQHCHALIGLKRINCLSNTAAQLFQRLQLIYHETPERPLRVLDIACGGGDIALALADRSRRQGLPLEIDGCDISSYALRHAREQARHKGIQTGFFQCNALETLPEGYDILLSSLFLHHLSEEEVISLLKRMACVSRVGFIISDLCRCRYGRLLALSAPRLVTRSPIVHSDALRSVDAAFTMEEIQHLAQKANLRNLQVHRAWPARFLLQWRRT